MDAVVELFCELARVNSPGKREGALASVLEAHLAGLGMRTWRDSAGEFIGGDTGNLMASLPGSGNLAGAEPVLLCAHMDTVQPTMGINLSIDDGWVHTDGSTILGADDKAGVAVILASLARLLRLAGPRRPVEVAFTVAEEIGLYGARYLDISTLSAREALVLDSGSAVGTFITKTPAHDEMKVVFIGRAAHAGVEPEKGISAIRVAAEAISAMPLGRLDSETTANVGVIQGGAASNIVADRVELQAEVRSASEAKLVAQVTAMREACDEAAHRHGASFQMQVERSFSALNVREDCDLLARLRAACGACGLTFATQMRGGGSDANVLATRGFTTVNMGLGMQNDHSGAERVSEADLAAAVDLLAAFLRS